MSVVVEREKNVVLIASAEQDILAVQRSLQECQDTVSTKVNSCPVFCVFG